MPVDPAQRPLWKNGLLLGGMLAFLIFSDWFHPGDARVRRHDGSEVSGVVLQETRDEIVVQADSVESGGPSQRLVLAKSDIAGIQESEGWVMDVYHSRWYLAAAMGLLVLVLAWRWLSGAELREWMHHTWEFTRMLVPLLFGGVFAVGFLSALLPNETIGRLVGDNGLGANLLASVVGTLFYFATLTEVPITQALIDHGMARGPALALLLAGPALSLPSILVLAKVMGARKTLAFSAVVVVAATLTGLVYGLT